MFYIFLGYDKIYQETMSIIQRMTSMRTNLKASIIPKCQWKF